jgi:ELWxxDGT repeat protein
MRRLRTLTAAALTSALLPLVGPAAADAAAPDGVVSLAAVPAGEGQSFAGRVFFSDSSTENGGELWVTDGTPAGTHLVVDLVPGAEGSHPQGLTVFRGRLYFNARTSGTGAELWSTDGTAAGTQLVADIYAGATSSFPSYLVVAGDRLYFSALDAAHGSELWAYDGTAAPALVMDIIPGVSSSSPYNLTALGDRVVYAAFTSPQVVKPFVSGPGVPGAHRLDPLAADVDLMDHEFSVLGDRVVFAAGVGATGHELWVSRGQAGDAHLLKDIDPGLVGSDPTGFRTFGALVLFAAGTAGAGRELWATDGTEQGTQLVRDINPGSGASGNPGDLTVLGAQVVFTADDGVHGRELWVTRGTAGSTHLVADSYAGPARGVTFGLYGAIPVAGQLLYAGTDARGTEPWVTDGTTARALADLAPGSAGSSPHPLGVIGNAVLFGASDGTTERLYAWTAVGSTTAVKTKRRYAANQARKKRIVLNVAVRSASGLPLSGGTVTLTRKGKAIGSATLVNGTARARITVRLRPGRTHRITAAWSGVTTIATASTSTMVKVRVRKSPRTRPGGAST